MDKVYFITDNPSSIYAAIEAFLANHLSQECHYLPLIADWSLMIFEVTQKTARHHVMLTPWGLVRSMGI